MNKLGVICLMLLIGVGIMGVSYGSWAQNLTIGGSVSTGTWDTEKTKTLFPTKDSYIDKDAIKDNYGAGISLLVSQHGNTDKRKALIQFDLSEIPSGKEINTAELFLNMAPIVTPNEPIAIYRITENWTELGVTWKSRDGNNDWSALGGVYASNRLDSIQPVVGWNSWDVLSDVLDFYSGNVVNNGWILIADGRGTYNKSFYSKEYDGGSLSPYLVITYED